MRIFYVSKDFCKWFEELGIKTRRIVGGSVSKKIHNPQFDEIDILVSTLGVVEKLSHAGKLMLFSGVDSGKFIF